jgi:hypothetical protein
MTNNLNHRNLEPDLKSFIENTPKRKQTANRPSCLDAHASDIQELHVRGFSSFRIQEFLKLKGVTVSTALISRYTKRFPLTSL